MSELQTTNLRDGWRVARVGEILKVRNGYAFKSTDYRDEGVRLIRQSNLGDDLVDVSDAKRVDPRFLKELPGFIVENDDLLIGMSGSLGKIARYQNSEPALQNQRTGLLMVKPGNDRKFAKLVLKYVEPQIIAEGKGIAVQNVSAKEIEDCVFPLPPIDDQRRIVAEIEKQFTRLEVGVAALRRVQANLKRYRAAVLKAACEGRLVPTEAELQQSGSGVPPLDPDSTAKPPPSKDSAKVPANPKRQDAASTSTSTFESGQQLLARILTERRQNWQGRGKYKDPLAPDIKNVGQIAESWVWASVDQLANETMIGLDRGRDQQSSAPETGVPYIKMNNVTMDGRVQCDALVFVPASREEAERYAVRDGDILFNTRNSKELVGKVGLVRCPPSGAVYNNNLMRIRLPEGVLPAFLTLQMCSQEFRQRMELVKKATTSVAAVYAKDLLPLAIALPPLPEQTRIVAEVERRLSVVEELEAVVTTNLQRANRLRQSILQKAFTGELQ